MLPPIRQPSPLASPSLPDSSSVPFPSSDTNRMPPPPPPTKHAPMLPVEPLPDSLLLRSTFSALDHSAQHLKRLSKAVLATSASVLALYNQLEAAENELFSSLGELASFLDVAPSKDAGANEGGVFGDHGVKTWRREQRRRDKEAMEKLVVETVSKLRTDIKHHALGLPGSHGAQARFENTAKQYYQSTSQYLAPSPSTSSSTIPAHSDSDLQHKVRTATFDLARYRYHSTLLHAVPPTSVPCIDALVGVYSWLINVVADSQPHSNQRSTLKTSSSSASSATSSSTTRVPSSQAITSQVSNRLASLAAYRAQLVHAWKQRHHQTHQLESDCKADEGVVWVEVTDGGAVSNTPPHKEPKKRRSVGGRLRDFLVPSASSSALATASSGDERRSRGSFDLSALRNHKEERPKWTQQPSSNGSSSFRTPPMDGSVIQETSPIDTRPALPSRHSIQLTPGSYTSLYNNEEPDKKWGGVGGVQGEGDEDAERMQAGRKKEGVLWGAGAWEGLGGQGRERAKWEKFWVVLEQSRIYEYRDGLGKPEAPKAAIDLKFASVREGRGTERRFVFEIVTPSQGRRLYQATSHEEMKAWMYAICNAIESCINGQSSIRTFDQTKLRTASGTLDDHALPRPHPMHGLGLGGIGNRRSMPAHPEGRWAKPTRKTSLKNAIRQSGERLHKAVGGRSPALEIPTHYSGSRTPTPEGTPSSRFSQHAPSVIDDEIEASVLAMAGVGLDPQRRVFSEAGAHLSAISSGGQKMERTRSADEAAAAETIDAALLRRVAALPENLKCADCGKPMKASRWATINLRGTPMVMFLCIRCCGIHRGLGTHVSKVRSLDLDRWSRESIALADEWGNERGNGIWERLKPADVVATDENIRDYIKSKYVDCRWLAAADAGALLDGSVGTAL